MSGAGFFSGEWIRDTSGSGRLCFSWPSLPSSGMPQRVTCCATSANDRSGKGETSLTAWGGVRWPGSSSWSLEDSPSCSWCRVLAYHHGRNVREVFFMTFWETAGVRVFIVCRWPSGRPCWGCFSSIRGGIDWPCLSSTRRCSDSSGSAMAPTWGSSSLSGKPEVGCSTSKS